MSKASTEQRGSTWKRWDPHIHTPGTLLANRFSGEDSWEPYLKSIEQSSPRIRALGITDYAVLDEVERVLAFKAAGRLPDVGLIFANVELRYELATAKGKQINVHLLISPETSDWLDRAKSFLSRLHFVYQDDTFVCSRTDLMRLGRLHTGSELEERAALEAGVNQFKVTRDGIRKAFLADQWAREHVLLGVSGTSGDGTAGLQADAALAAARRDIERSAHVIFASSPKQRDFWIGNGVDDVATLKAKYGGVKVCLHGSDSHSDESVGKPHGNRFTWIKGDLTFEALRQACIEPELRAIVSESPPEGPTPARTISAIEIEGTDWFENRIISINPGLVGIIGPRGSGKTALADLIAAAAYVRVEDNADAFVERAKEHLRGTKVRLHWGDGEVTERVLHDGLGATLDDARVRYLSQQFVERLCSSDRGLTDELLREIERVVFDTHSEDDRDGATDFSDLLSITTSRQRASREHHQQALIDAGTRIEEERLKHSKLSTIRAQHDQLAARILKDKARRTALQSTRSTADSTRLGEISKALDQREAEYTTVLRRRHSLLALRDEVQELATRELPERVEQLKRSHAAAALTAQDWSAFEIKFAGDPAAIASTAIETCDQQLSEILGPPLPEGAASKPLVGAEAQLATNSLGELRGEASRLKEALGLDRARATQLEALEKKIRSDERVLSAVAATLDDASGARARIQVLQDSRNEAYAALVDAIRAEEAQLKKLYVPVGEMLAEARGALGKLEFVVQRTVNVHEWAALGEELIDLRTEGEFRGRGSIAKRAASDGLVEAWASGGGTEAAEALAIFRDRYDQSLREQRRTEYNTAESKRAWAGRVSAWLTSTAHIKLTYGITFGGVPIEQLSPGTRGIVLLLLYLSLDQTDDRPLIIDQPEENLDPASIFTELVGRFRDVRARRQVLIVTHNANLIVNTDVDQVIAASDGVHRPGQLPALTYVSGGIEEKAIRDRVCDVLEGGEDALRDRARRLRVQLT